MVTVPLEVMGLIGDKMFAGCCFWDWLGVVEALLLLSCFLIRGSFPDGES